MSRRKKSLDWTDLDWTHTIGAVRIQAQSKAQQARDRWPTEPTIRVYAVGVEATALQLRGVLDTPSEPPAYAHGVLHHDEDLVALYDALGRRIKERGLSKADLREIRAAIIVAGRGRLSMAELRETRLELARKGKP